MRSTQIWGYLTNAESSGEVLQGNQAPVLSVLQNIYLSSHFPIHLFIFFFTEKKILIPQRFKKIRFIIHSVLFCLSCSEIVSKTQETNQIGKTKGICSPRAYTHTYTAYSGQELIYVYGST